MDNNNSHDRSTQTVKRTGLVTLSAGCLTIAVAGLAILAGFLIDSRLGTGPRWTLILLLGSAPFTLAAVFLIARRAVRRLRAEAAEEGVEEAGDSPDKINGI